MYRDRAGGAWRHVLNSAASLERMAWGVWSQEQGQATVTLACECVVEKVILDSLDDWK